MASLRLPQEVIDANIFIDGYGFLGVSQKDDIKLPEIEEIQEDFKAGGFEQSYGTGTFKKLEFEISVKEVNPVIFAAMGAGLKSGKGILITIKGSIAQEGKKLPFVATIKSNPNIQIEGAKTTIKGVATYFEYEYKGIPLCRFNTKNMIAEIGGIDYLAELRNQIS